MITKDDFMGWKDNPVTKAFFESVKSMEEDAIESLVKNDDRGGTMSDDFFKGAITVLRDILNTSFVDVETFDNDN